MEIEIEANIVVTESAIDPDAISKLISKLMKRRNKYKTRIVGELHSLSMNDKAAWVRNSEGPLRIVEADTGREEIWFYDVYDTPTYLSVNSDGLLESHKKYNLHMPAIHYTRSDTPISNKKIRVFDSHLDLWYHNQKLSNFEGMPAVNAGSRVFKIKDTKIDYIRYILFDRIEENWEDGVWKGSNASGPSIIFERDDLNTEPHRLKATQWLNEHCQGGFYPFGEQLFGDDEEEFLFVADICT